MASKVRCAYCDEYIKKDDAYNVGFSNFCDSGHFYEYKREEQERARKRRKKTAMPGSVRAAVKARDDGCMLCGSYYQLDVHHIKYRSEGGKHEIENLITLCRTDHALVHSDKKRYQPFLLNLVEILERDKFDEK